jgi:hypothetical protein
LARTQRRKRGGGSCHGLTLAGRSAAGAAMVATHPGSPWPCYWPWSPAALRAVVRATAGFNPEARQNPGTSAGTIYSDTVDDLALSRPGQYSLSSAVVINHYKGDAPAFCVMILEYPIID